MAGVQTAIDPETGEIMDADVLRELYTETSVAGKITTADRLRLGEIVEVTLTAQVIATGTALNKDNLKVHVQKLRVDSIGDVTRGAL